MAIKRDLVVYHPGTGTAVPLSDKVFLIDYSRLKPDSQDNLVNGTMEEYYAEAIGIRIDNFNMGNLFFGGN